MLRFGKFVAHMEAYLAEQEANNDPEHTLMLQLTGLELAIMQYGLFLLGVFYPGGQSIRDLEEKIIQLVHVQEFCQCPRCIERREQEDDNA